MRLCAASAIAATRLGDPERKVANAVRSAKKLPQNARPGRAQLLKSEIQEVHKGWSPL